MYQSTYYAFYMIFILLGFFYIIIEIIFWKDKKEHFLTYRSINLMYISANIYIFIYLSECALMYQHQIVYNPESVYNLLRLILQYRVCSYHYYYYLIAIYYVTDYEWRSKIYFLPCTFRPQIFYVSNNFYVTSNLSQFSDHTKWHFYHLFFLFAFHPFPHIQFSICLFFISHLLYLNVTSYCYIYAHTILTQKSLSLIQTCDSENRLNFFFLPQVHHHFRFHVSIS